MNNKIKILGFALVFVLAVAAIGAGIAYAQTPTQTAAYGSGGMMGRGGMNGRGGMMGGNAQSGANVENMNAMHQWMNADGGMHTIVWNALAEKLGLTSDELTAEVNSGKTVAQIGEEKGISRTDLAAFLETAHEDSLAQAVTDGVMTQEQADTMLAQMAGRYEYMLDNMSSTQGSGLQGQGMMGGRGGNGGMMNGQRGAGGCQGTGTATTQPKP